MRLPATLGVTALLLTLTACGSSGSGGNKTAADATLTPTTPPSAAPSQVPGSAPPETVGKSTTCGKIQIKGNEESVIRIKGTTPCATVMTVITAYDKAPKQGSNGEATIKSWKCKTASAADNARHGYITQCVKGPDEFVTKLKGPAA